GARRSPTDEQVSSRPGEDQSLWPWRDPFDRAPEERRLDFGKALLDRIEIGTVGRQVAQCSVRRFDDLAHPISLVSRQVIDDDDVAWPQRRRQAFLQIFDEDRTVHRAIDDERSGEAIKPKPGHKGHGLPVAPRNAADNPATALGPSEKP